MEERSMVDISFILAKSDQVLDPVRIVAAAKELGLDLTAAADGSTSFTIEGGGGAMVAALIGVAHPDAPMMPIAPTSPTRDDIAAAKAHIVVTGVGLAGDVRERDTLMAALTASVIGATEAVGAMLGHGVVFHKAALFQAMAASGFEEGELPVAIAVDITGAKEPEDRMSFLTHGMRRYGREEVYFTAPARGKGALGFVLDLMSWMLGDMDHAFPTGDTIGRDDGEKLKIQRVASPAGNPEQVIRLDLPD